MLNVVINVLPVQIILIAHHVKAPIEALTYLIVRVFPNILMMVLHKALVNISQFTFHFYFQNCIKITLSKKRLEG